MFHDRTLGQIAEEQPADLDALAEIAGVGPTKLDRYGDEVLAVVAASRVTVARLACPQEVTAMIDIKELQRPLRERYEADPDSAPLTLTVRSAPSDLDDPLHVAITPDAVPDVVWRSGAHPAVGGVGDVPCSGDLLLGALAACQEVTLRMVAANHGLALGGGRRGRRG